MAMITHGWTWTQSTWRVEPNEKQDELPPPSMSRRASTGSTDSSSGSSNSVSAGSDGEGWVYAASFGSIEKSGSAVKGMTHFVRRRRRTREQTFVGE